MLDEQDWGRLNNMLALLEVEQDIKAAKDEAKQRGGYRTGRY